MAFSTKLNLDDSKFEQQSGSTLNLDGQVIIGNDNGLRYSEVPTLTGDTQVATKKYVDDNVVSGSTYNLSSPAAITLGGITAGDELTGLTAIEILEDLLVPTLFPTLTAPSNTFADDAANIQEVGTTASTINFTATFDRGSITPDYGTSGFRSGLPNEYNYSDNGNVGASLPATQASTSLTDNQSLNDVEIQEGANTWSSSVDYDAGEQPLDSTGGNFSSPLAAGTTGTESVTITGIYPIFYGTSSTKPTAGSALLTSSTKVVQTSNGTVTIPFNTSGAEFTWMAIPATSTNKTIWYVTALSNGNIATSSPTSDKYVRTDGVSVDSPTGLWNGVNYDFYISETSTIDTTVEFRKI